MYNAISSSLPQFKKIVLLIFAVMVCLVTYTGIRVITRTSNLRIVASSTESILARSFVRTGNTAIRASNPARTLSFAERVSYQRAIEEVSNGSLSHATVPSFKWSAVLLRIAIAYGLAPADGRESAIVAALQPGNYTAIVRGVNDTTGIGLVEVYSWINIAFAKPTT